MNQTPQPSGAERLIGDFAPKLVSLTDDVLFGDIWRRFSGVDIGNTWGADIAIASMDSALSALNAGRADLGAYQNRFSSAIANVQTAGENLTASRSRIVDTDFAAETATLSRNQVLQQAGTAMLAQANAMPQSVLALLRG